MRRGSYLAKAEAHFPNPTTFVTIVLMTGLFLLPAICNGFPFVFYDSGTYLIGGIREPSRPPFYSVFNKLVDLNLSPWLGVVVQTLVASCMIWRVASTVFGITRALRMILLAILLTAGTSLPWFAGWIMPDILTPLMVIALALLCFTQGELSRGWGVVLVLTIAAALAFHQANVLVAAWALPALGLCALLGWRATKPSLKGLFAIGIGVTLGVIALVAVNMVAGRGVGLSSNGSVFLLARLLDDGTALSYLEQVCPQQGFAICTQLDELRSYYSVHASSNESLSDHFLWNGPLDKLGGFQAEQREASAIIKGTLSEYPVAQLRAAAHNGWRQLFLVHTGTELESYSKEEYVSTAIRDRFGGSIYADFRNSNQMRNMLDFDLINRIHVGVMITSSLLLIGVGTAVGLKKGRKTSLYATIFVMTLVAGNALTLGALSGPHDRYQSRVMWLVPLLAGCFVLGPQLRNARERPVNHPPVFGPAER
jgi:hypothetical protein